MLLSACSAARPCWGGLWLLAASAGAVPRTKPDCTELHLSPRTPSPAIQLCRCAGVHFKQLFDWIGAGGLSIAPRPGYECAIVNNGAKGALLCDSKLASATPHDPEHANSVFSLRAGVSNATLSSRVVTRTAEPGWAAIYCGYVTLTPLPCMAHCDGAARSCRARRDAWFRSVSHV